MEELTFYHFNDVYHISDVDLISRFAHVLKSAKAPGERIQPVTIFSGDAFSPSLEASVLKGEHIVPLLNDLQIDVACYGNHADCSIYFDFGETRLIELSQQTNFPWVLSNCVHAPTDVKHGGELLACARDYFVKTVGSYRVGFFGLAGTDWPSNCQHLPPSHILPPASVAKVKAKHLRTVEGCDFVIAITHMRLAEDLEVSDATRFGEESDRVDLLLGGHDHEVVCRFAGDTDARPEIILPGSINKDIVRNGQVADVEGNVRIVKSGSDWSSYSIVRLEVGRRPEMGTAYLSKVKLSQCHDIKRFPFYESLPASSNTPATIAAIQGRIADVVKQPLVHTRVLLEGRSSICRSQETNLGNMLADAVRAFYETEIALVNSGGIRCNRVIGPTGISNGQGALCVKDIIDITPFDNAFVVKRVHGHALLTALENSVSDAHTDGRFLQYSGVRIVVSWRRRQGTRILEAYHVPRIGPEEKIEAHRIYTVAMVSFIALGFDGYTIFRGEETIIGEEGAMTDTRLMLQLFGYSPSENRDKEAEEDKTAQGIQRAKEAILIGENDQDCLPVVGPVLDGRIQFVDSASL